MTVTRSLSAFSQQSPPLPGPANAWLGGHIALLVQNYQTLLAKSLPANPQFGKSLAEQLFHAPFALLSHNTDPDPLFNYANKTALELFELNWPQLVKMPSRLSAEPVNRKERERLLAQVSEKGFIDNYQGVRISRTGRRFLIRNAVVWNLFDQGGQYQGQAACFNEWEFLH